MKILILFFALICETFAFSLLRVQRDVGPKDCAQGPEYWCQNLETAKSCGAVKHCIQDVWNHMNLPKDDSDICETCKKMVQEARDQLESNETQQEIREVLEGTCKIYFPIKALANECIKYVDEFIPELIEMLASRMDPQLVCATAGLCNADAIKHRLTAEKLTYHLPTPSDCQDCKKFMQNMITDVQQASEEEVRQKLLGVCSHLPPQYSSVCHLFVIENINQIYEYLKSQGNPDEMCQLIGMCDETTNIQTINSLVELFIVKTDPDIECEFCEQLVLYLKNLLIANSTEEEVKDMLLEICHKLGGLSDECENFINENFQEIYAFLTDELDPEMICTAIGICNDNSSSPLIALTLPKQQNNFPKQELSFLSVESNDVNSAPNSDKKIQIKVPFSKTVKMQPKPEDMQLPETRLFPQALLPKKSDIGCALCEYVLHDLQTLLMDNKTVEAIKSALDRVCGLLPKTLTDQCTDFINQYGNAILALIAQEIDPSVVCVELKICDAVVEKKPNPADIQLPPSRLLPNILAKSYKTAETCQLCQYLMGIVHNMLKDNNTKEAIEAALNKACLDLPKSMQPKCTKFMEQYGDKILTLLQEVDPSIVCAMLKLCPAYSKQGIVPIKDLKMGKCDICQMVVDYVDKLLEEQTVEEDISKVLEKVCNIVPQSAREQCDTIIETYGPYLLQLLAELADSKQICQAIDLCNVPAGQVHLLGGNKCTYGPSYWCKSKLHAQACKAEKHCKEHVWKTV